MIRLIDIFLSLIALIILAPIFCIIIPVLALTGEGEIFYKQKRVGINQNDFYLFKFATMLKNSELIGTGEITVKNDPRVLPIGNFLRKTKINELPQVLNILLGDISFIGPRPMTPKTFEKYASYRDIIASVRPGLSGIGSIFFRDEEKYLSLQDEPIKFYFDIIHPAKARLEEWFVQNYSLRLYLKCIFVTFWVVVFPNSKIFYTAFPNAPKFDTFSDI